MTKGEPSFILVIIIVTDNMKDYAKSAGRMTRQRKIILDELRKVTTHPTADEIYEMARHRLPRISLGTVYRNLDVLSEGGHIQKLESGGTQMRFDGDVARHYHARCLKCGRVADIPASQSGKIDKALDVIHVKSEYEILGRRLEFVGICPDCKNNNPNT